ncbi:MAG: FAD-dependent oxidoreductase [Proteobacteria bacterium]|nr:FAD-dependent oxidoreductase [Pseudomonadota bacterium]
MQHSVLSGDRILACACIGLTRLASAINDNGARSVIQINHGGKNTHSMMVGGKTPVAPSAIVSRMTRETTRALEPDEVWEVIDSFAQAASRGKKAGFDAVEVLAGTGYLVSSFLSQLTNQRTDEWGGSYENRMRFGVEVIKAIRKAVGDDYAVLVRMNGNDLMPEGVGREELQVFARHLVEAGVDAININVSWHDARIPQIVTSVPRAAFGYLSKEMKEKVDVPVFTGHRVHDIETARELIRDGACDMVALATGASPVVLPIPGVDLPNVVQAWDVLSEKVRCGKKVAVVGGGAVGVEVALYLAEKGTPSGDAIKFLLINDVETPEDLLEIATKGTKQVVLLEMLDKVGRDIGKSTRWVMMQDLSRYGVTVKTQTKATEITSTGIKVEIDGQVEAIDADTVVLASGSESSPSH